MIRAERCQADEVRHLLDALPGPKTDAAGIVDLDDCVRRGQVFRVLEQGAMVAAYVLQPAGAELWITAFIGAARFDLVQALAGLVEQQGREFDAVCFRTERAGLVRKARREGYHVYRQDGRSHFMRKRLRP